MAEPPHGTADQATLDTPRAPAAGGPRIAFVPYGANEIRLTLGQWGIAAAVLAASLIFLPHLGRLWEPFHPADDYRIPYAASEDYWQYQRWIETIEARQQTPIVGDSVVWGVYVTPHETLAQALNRQLGKTLFANAGVNGSHPLALEGLVRYYGRAIHNDSVILHCNLLWSSSAERDLQTTKEIPFNHPQLVPQFDPWIPAYKATLEDRLSNIVECSVPFRSWVNHLRIAHFSHLDLHSWSLEHPYQNPLTQLGKVETEASQRPDNTSKPWFERGIRPQDMPWLDPDDSLQFHAFQRMLGCLRGRGNRVFVVVGPFNEYMLTPASRRHYQAVKRAVAEWLQQQGVAYWVPEVLPSNQYGDASHPLAAGYQRLAAELLHNGAFQHWLAEAGP